MCIKIDIPFGQAKCSTFYSMYVPYYKVFNWFVRKMKRNLEQKFNLCYFVNDTLKQYSILHGVQYIFKYNVKS